MARAVWVKSVNKIDPNEWWNQSGAAGDDMKLVSPSLKPRITTSVSGSVEASTAPRYTKSMMGSPGLAWSRDEGNYPDTRDSFRYVPNLKYREDAGGVHFDIGKKKSEYLGTQTISPMPVMEQNLDVESFNNLLGGSIKEGMVNALDPACTSIGVMNVLATDGAQTVDGTLPVGVPYNRDSCSPTTNPAGPQPAAGYIDAVPSDIQYAMGSEYSWDPAFANYINRDHMVKMRDAISTSHLKNELLGQIDHINMLNNEEMNTRVRESVGRMYLTADEPNYHDSMLKERNRALRVTKVLAQQRKDLTRHAEINTYYRKQFQMKKRIIGETALVFIIIYVLYVLRSQGILPVAMFQTFVVIILFVFLIFRLSYNLIDYWSRDTKYFDEYDWAGVTDTSYVRVEKPIETEMDGTDQDGCDKFASLRAIRDMLARVAIAPTTYNSTNPDKFIIMIKLMQSFAHLIVRDATAKDRTLENKLNYADHIAQTKLLYSANREAADGLIAVGTELEKLFGNSPSPDLVTNIITDFSTYSVGVGSPSDVAIIKNVFVTTMNSKIAAVVHKPSARPSATSTGTEDDPFTRPVSGGGGTDAMGVEVPPQPAAAAAAEPAAAAAAVPGPAASPAASPVGASTTGGRAHWYSGLTFPASTRPSAATGGGGD